MIQGEWGGGGGGGGLQFQYVLVSVWMYYKLENLETSDFVTTAITTHIIAITEHKIKRFKIFII